MIVKETGEKFENAPAGTHLARCIGLIDVGTHTSEWKGNPIRRRQMILKWELPLELRKDEQPFVVSEFYTMSLSEKANLRKDLVNWRGKEFTQKELEGFDLRNILGVGCQVTITEKENGKIKVTGVTGLPKGVDLPEQHNPSVYFDLDFFDQELFDSLTDGLKKLIEDSEEYQAEFGETNYSQLQKDNENLAIDQSGGMDSDQIPF